jgi:type III restriction enzyme
MHEVKDKRQLIFATHNANLVVNGASEFVIAMNSDDSGPCRIECEGAIDQSDVRLAITDTMEGGNQAFRGPAAQYGF